MMSAISAKHQLLLGFNCVNDDEFLYTKWIKMYCNSIQKGVYHNFISAYAFLSLYTLDQALIDYLDIK